MSLLNSEDKSPILKVRNAIQQYVEYVNNNSLDSNETINIKLEKEDSNRPSSVNYEGPEGKFTIKVSPQKQQVTADVKFTTGDFKATLTNDKHESKGVEPVFHKHWGQFHEAFLDNSE